MMKIMMKKMKKVYQKKLKKLTKKKKKITISLDVLQKQQMQIFIQTFYFGINETKDYKEKIVFDKENYPISYLLDGICQNAIDFLNVNKYPLLTKVDKYLLKELDDEPRILLTLIIFPNNTKINYFIFSMYKKLSFDKRKYIFGYVNYTEDPFIL